MSFNNMPEKDVRVIFQPMNRVLTVPTGTPLLDAMRTAGVAIESICGGKGTCRKCKVILINGKCDTIIQPGAKRLTAEEEEKGYYLACQVRLTGESEFTIPVESRIDSPKILISSTIKVDKLSPSVVRYPVEVVPSPYGLPSIRFAGYAGVRPYVPDKISHALRESTEHLIATLSLVNASPEVVGLEPAAEKRPAYGVAVDLGTTTVVGCLVDLQTGMVIGTESTLNRQITYGEELITRIGYANTPESLARISGAAVDSVDSVINALVKSAGIRRSDIVDMCLAGNTVMQYLFMGMDPRDLEMVNADISRAPFIKKADDLSIPLGSDVYVYLLPNVSRFVGGDAIGDVIASNMHMSDEVSLLVDLGTNGEIILGNRDWMASVSCASGPAFEGAGVKFGIRAMKGAIEHVSVDPATSEVTHSTIGNVPPRGICGSGIVDVMTAMVSTGALDFAGKFRSGHSRVRTGEEGPEYVLVPADRSGIGRDIVITQHDVDYFMDSKAAACGAIGVLLKKYKLTVWDIKHVYLAGAFGAYTDMNNAIRIGFIPEFPNAAIHQIGNGALSGAYATLISREHRAMAETIARKMAYIDLMVESEFFEEYLAALYIPGKREMFPGYYTKKEFVS
jgi:uncharacterized 2Fe-2S/4Fe-4S cluster protein (DUF4445 family)